MAYNNTLPTGGYNPQMGAFPNMPQMGMGPLGMIPPMMMGMSQLARGGMGGQERQAPIGEPIFIDGVKRYKARPGTKNNKLAIKITETIRKEDE